MKKLLALLVTGTVLFTGACTQSEVDEVATESCEVVGAICGFLAGTED